MNNETPDVEIPEDHTETVGIDISINITAPPGIKERIVEVLGVGTDRDQMGLNPELHEALDHAWKGSLQTELLLAEKEPNDWSATSDRYLYPGDTPEDYIAISHEENGHCKEEDYDVLMELLTQGKFAGEVATRTRDMTVAFLDDRKIPREYEIKAEVTGFGSS